MKILTEQIHLKNSVKKGADNLSNPEKKLTEHFHQQLSESADSAVSFQQLSESADSAVSSQFSESADSAVSSQFSRSLLLCLKPEPLNRPSATAAT